MDSPDDTQLATTKMYKTWLGRYVNCSLVFLNFVQSGAIDRGFDKPYLVIIFAYSFSMRLSRAVLIISFLLFGFHAQAQWTTSSPFGGALVNSSIVIGGRVLVGTNTGGVFSSLDNGITWVPRNTGLTYLDVRSFASIGNDLFAGTFGGGVFRSTDYGATWIQENAGLTNPFVQAMISVGNKLLVGTEACFGCIGGGVFLSTDFGASWNPANNGITNNSVNCLAAIDSYVFAGSYGNGVYRSSDEGTSWIPVNSGLNNNVSSIYASESNLYAATQQGVYLSIDNGNSWKAINNGLLNEYTNLPYLIYSLAKSGNYLFAGSINKVYFSTNQGSSWSTVLNGPLNKHVFIHNEKVFVSSPSGFYSQPLIKFPIITSLVPQAGIIGSTITIKGKGFSNVPAENNIYLGSSSTVATTATIDSLTFVIPPGTISSSVSVSVNGQFASTLDTLTIIPNITYFIPENAPPRARIKIGGTGFSPIPIDNIVIINGKNSFVALSSQTTMEVIVPDSAFIGVGNVSVTVNKQTGSSPFTVTPPLPLPAPGGSGNIIWTPPIRAGFTCNSMAINSMDNLYFLGQLANYGGMDRQFFNYSLFPGYSFDTYLIKSDTSYNIKWRKIIKSTRGTGSSFLPDKIQTDKDGNVVVIGRFAESFIIDSLTVKLPDEQPDSKYGLLIAKISSTGKLLWYNLIKTSTYSNSIYDLKIDDAGNIYFAGGGIGKWDFYNNNAEVFSISTGINGSFGYFAQYTTDGVFKWVKSFTQGYQVIIKGLEIDKKKNIFVTGSWYGMGSFESIAKASPSEDIIIAKFDSLRNLIWLKQIGAYYNDTAESGNAIALDENLSCLYVTGSFVKGNFGSGETNSDDQNIFLARYSFDGDLNWLIKMGSWSGAASFTETGNKLTVDRDGFIFLGGVLGPLSLGFDGVQVGAYRDPTNSNFYNDGFLGKYAATGKLLWVQHFGDPNFDDYLTTIIKDSKNNLYFSGGAGTNAIFGTYQRPFSNGIGFAGKIIDQKENLFELSASSFQIEAGKDLTRQFQIITDQGWTLSSNVGWLSTSVNKGKGNIEVILTATANSSTQRSGVITATSDSGIKRLVEIQQEPSINPIITGVISADTVQIILYPNPTKGKLNLYTDLNISELQIVITDISGSEILNSHVTNFEIDVNYLPPGVYFLKVSTSSHKFIKRFIKL